MDVTPAREKSDLGVVFHDLAERFKKRGVVVVLSDLLDEVPRILTGLEAPPPPPPRGDCFSHPRPRRGRVSRSATSPSFQGMEGMPDVVADPHGLRRAYQAELKTYLDDLKRGCQAMDMSTTSPCKPTRTSTARSPATSPRAASASDEAKSTQRSGYQRFIRSYDATD